jgi:hypothetical protein
LSEPTGTGAIGVSLYKRKYFFLSEAVGVIAGRLAAADRRSCASADGIIDAARNQLLEALFEGAIGAEGVMRYSTRRPIHKPPLIECDEWIPIPQGLWSTDEIAIDWGDDYVDYFDKRNGEIVGLVYAKIRVLRADIDREFPIPVLAALDCEPSSAPAETDYRTGVAGRPSSKHLAEQEMQRRASHGILCSGVGAEMRELCLWLRLEHPRAPPVKPKSLENSLRGEYRNLKQSMTLPE